MCGVVVVVAVIVEVSQAVMSTAQPAEHLHDLSACVGKENTTGMKTVAKKQRKKKLKPCPHGKNPESVSLVQPRHIALWARSVVVDSVMGR